MTARRKPLNLGEAIAVYTLITHDETKPEAVRNEAKKVAGILENACDHIFARRQMMARGQFAEDIMAYEFLNRVMEELDV